MNRKTIEKKIRKALMVLYSVIFLIEVVALWFIIPNNDMELLTVSMSFPQVMAIVLLMNIPLFLFVSITVNVMKEAFLWHNSPDKKKTNLNLSLSSLTLALVSFILWVATNNTASTKLNGVLFCVTVLSFSACIITFFIYVFKKKD